MLVEVHVLVSLVSSLLRTCANAVYYETLLLYALNLFVQVT